MTEQPTCGTCRFWEPQDHVEPPIGECHRNPAVIVAGPQVDPDEPWYNTLGIWNATHFPVLDCSAWCGEWQATPPAAESERGQ